MKKAKFIKTKKSIETSVFKLQLDEVIWVNGRRAARDVIRHNGITAIVPILEKKAEVPIHTKIILNAMMKIGLFIL